MTPLFGPFLLFNRREQICIASSNFVKRRHNAWMGLREYIKLFSIRHCDGDWHTVYLERTITNPAPLVNPMLLT